jgi:hypothetical protein
MTTVMQVCCTTRYKPGVLTCIATEHKSIKSDAAEPNFARDLDHYMDLDLQQLMAMVNDKYKADDSDQEDIDPLDIEALKKQYCFDD